MVLISLFLVDCNETVTVSTFESKKPDTRAVYLEWFSINGGKRFGINRLAYFIAYEFIQSCLQELAELDVITLWRNVNYQDFIFQQLIGMTTKNV